MRHIRLVSIIKRSVAEVDRGLEIRVQDGVRARAHN